MFFFFENDVPAWENFEIECTDYLNKEFGKKYNCTFLNAGGHDSNAPDINIIHKNKHLFSIEAKMNEAQCGQFVLSPDNSTHKFTFSDKNKCDKNEYVDAIIASMEENYDLCIDTLDDLPIPETIICNWVKDYYINKKGSKFFITRSHYGNYIIVPVHKLEQYFNVSAKFRVKRSGSANPTHNNIPEIKAALDNNGLNYSLIIIDKDKSVFGEIESNKESFKIDGIKYRYLFRNVGRNRYAVRRLSNTCNSNFIVSITLKNGQQPEDLAEFIASLTTSDTQTDRI